MHYTFGPVGNEIFYCLLLSMRVGEGILITLNIYDVLMFVQCKTILKKIVTVFTLHKTLWSKVEHSGTPEMSPFIFGPTAVGSCK